MGILGKILLFFNFILAVAVLALAGMDYGKRQSWRYAHRLHEITRAGVPVDGLEKDTREPREEPIVADITDGMAKEVFAKAGGGQFSGPPVKTVKEELARVHVLVRNTKLTSKKDAKYYMVPLARTLGERQDLVALIDKDDEAAGLPATKAEFDRRAKAAETTATTSPGYKDLRQSIGRFLLGLNFSDDQWRLRCMTVLGMEAYIEAVSRHADALVTMSVDVERAMANDRAIFERQHLELVQSILKESDELFKAKVYLDDLKKTAAERETQVAQRKTERDEETNKLAQARADADTAIAKLKAVQKDLFALQQRKGLALQKNQQLEQELRQLEQKR